MDDVYAGGPKNMKIVTTEAFKMSTYLKDYATISDQLDDIEATSDGITAIISHDADNTPVPTIKALASYFKTSGLQLKFVATTAMRCMQIEHNHRLNYEQLYKDFLAN